MRILLTNDDGIFAPSLILFKNELLKLGQVEVVAPLSERSASSHSITLNKPIVHEKIYQNGSFLGHGISGSPADCVKVAFTEFLESPADLVVSGINIGANVGINVFYSGTVAAAVEGAMLGVTSVAVSLQWSEKPAIEGAARIASKLIKAITRQDLRDIRLFNVNLPDGNPSEIRGMKFTRQSILGYDESFERRVDSSGRATFWMKGNIPVESAEEDSDVLSLAEGYITITPLHYDLTHYKNLNLLRSWKWDIDFGQGR